MSWAWFGAVTLITTGALADPSVIIRERAKELSNQNNVRQGVGSPIQPTTRPGMSPAAPAGPTISPALQRFNVEISTIHADASVTAEQKQKLAQDLLASPQGGRFSLAAAAKLANDLSAAFIEKPLSPASRARFVQELDAVFNPGKYPQAKVEGILKDIQAIFQDNGLARVKAVAIAEDVRAISAEIQRGGG